MLSRKVTFLIVSVSFFTLSNANLISPTNLSVEKITNDTLVEIATQNKSAFILFLRWVHPASESAL